MNFTLRLLALVAVAASVVYAAPLHGDEEIAIQDVRTPTEKALKRLSHKEIKEIQAQLQSFLADMEQDGTLQEKRAKKQLVGTLLGLADPEIIGHGG